ncbi:MAG: hypothetical protein AB1925_12665 [Actinomycetota bacterium]
MPAVYDPQITVCEACRTAACFQGEFMCENAKTARVLSTAASLLVTDGRAREHPDWWNKDLDQRCRRRLTTDDLRRLGITEPRQLAVN